MSSQRIVASRAPRSVLIAVGSDGGLGLGLGGTWGHRNYPGGAVRAMRLYTACEDVTIWHRDADLRK